MTCPSTENLLRFVYNEMSSGEQDQMQRHLAECGDCREDMALFKDIEANLRRVAYDESQPDNTTAACLDTTTLATYLSGQLPLAEREAVEAHLVRCRACVDEIVAVDAQLMMPLIQTPAQVIAQTITVRKPETSPGEETSPRPLRLIPGRRTEADLKASLHCYGRSAALLTDFLQPDALAAATDETAGFAQVNVFHSQDQRAQATVRATAPGTIAVAIETRDAQLAMQRWGFRFTRQDGIELCNANMPLHPIPDEPGLWEGRLEISLRLTDPWRFEFYTLSHDAGERQ